MPEYRYQAATLPGGTPVYGTQLADSETDLRMMLAARGQNLLLAQVICLDQALMRSEPTLSRVWQLRLGERLSEAFLTGLPAHDAVRAMAAEPFEHPLLMMFGWLKWVFAGLAVPAAVQAMLVPGSSRLLVIAASALTVTVLAEFIATRLLHARLQRLLCRLADRLESGDSCESLMLRGLPKEIRSISTAKIDERVRAVAVSELLPSLAGLRFHRQKFFLRVAAPLLLLSVFACGMYLVMWLVIPGFSLLFTDFGIEIPLLTEITLEVSSLTEKAGGVGFLILLATAISLMVGLYASLANGWITETLARLPWFGVPVRWMMQAQVARVLSVLLRHNCHRGEAIKIATQSTGFPSVREDGRQLAEFLDQGKPLQGASQLLSGLPMALLSGRARTGETRILEGQAVASQPPANEPSHDQDQRISRSFLAIASMLEQGSQGHAALFGMICQFVLTVLTGMLIGILILSVFLPLIKLLNNLA